MFAIIRRYRTTSTEEVVSKIEAEFLPIIRNAPGLVAYYVVDEGQNVQSSISIFEDQEFAEYSNKLAAAWVRQHPYVLPETPDIASGEVLLYTTASGAAHAGRSVAPLSL
ncbi:MAG: hypothetical protein HY423_12690 [Candidatus Lambdaproteobacteria bacterium]|nr:hypothetical protein [Candidatus Lambdaproteobacteria bacterium]